MDNRIDEAMRRKLPPILWSHLVKDDCSVCEKPIEERPRERQNRYWRQGNYCTPCTKECARMTAQRKITEAELDSFFRMVENTEN